MLRSSLTLAFVVIAACSPDIDLGGGDVGAAVAAAVSTVGSSTTSSTSTAATTNDTTSSATATASTGCNGGASGTITSGAGGDGGFGLPNGNDGAGFVDYPTSIVESPLGSILVSSDEKDDALFYVSAHDSAFGLRWRRAYGLGAVDKSGDLVAGAGDNAFAILGSSPVDVTLDCATLAAGQPFVVVLDGDGAVVLAKSFQTNNGGSFALTGVVFTSTGDVVIGGTFSGDFQYGGGTLHTDTTAAFVLRMSLDGTIAWARPLDGVFQPQLGMAHNDVVYVASTIAPTMTGVDSDGIEIDALDAAGDPTLHDKFDGIGARVTDAIMDNSSLMVAGSFSSSLDLGAAGLFSTNDLSVFLSSFDLSTAKAQWASQRATTTGDARVTLDGTGGVVLAYSDTSDISIERFDPGSGATINQTTFGTPGLRVLGLGSTDSAFLLCGGVLTSGAVTAGFADTFSF